MIDDSNSEKEILPDESDGDLSSKADSCDVGG